MASKRRINKVSKPTSVDTILETIKAGGEDWLYLGENHSETKAKINRLIDEARIDELRCAKGVAHVMMDYTRPILNLSMKPDNPYFRVLATDVEYIENRIKELSNNLKEEQV